jgi:pilus assembly protein CpaC
MRILGKPAGLPLALALAVAAAGSVSAPIAAQTMASAPRDTVQIATGRGRLVTLDAPMTDLFVADDKIADVQVRSPTQLYIFGRAPGETTVYATTKSGRVVYAATVRIGNNYDTIAAMLNLAMPEASIVATTMNGIVLLTGTIATPGDAAEAERLVQAFVGEKTTVVSRLKTATPLQVNLQVRIAEVSRSFIKNIGVNLATRDQTGGFMFGIGSGVRSPGTIGTPDLSSLPVLDASAKYGFPAGTISLPFDPATGNFVLPGTGTTFTAARGTANTAIAMAGKLFGLDVLSALDLGERINQVTTLSNPNLTALSGETGSFLAGGEIPIPISQGLGAVSVEFKQYGVSLSYTPTVLSDGRISLRVRPEVSQITSVGATTVNGGAVPGISTRRVETTVELGSGQSLVIGGLLQNNHDNSIDKAPGLGDLPGLGALFRSNGFQRNETELVIVITPYLVQPVNANDIVLPTDGYKAPTDAERVLLGTLGSGRNGGERPKPSMEIPTVAPSLGASAPAGVATPAGVPPAQQSAQPAAIAAPPPAKPGKKKGGASATPGFSLN